MEVIAVIKKWVKKGGDCQICWLHGPAGSGKSAISQTIAEWCVHKETLAASFFFRRGAGDRSSIARLVSTLAHQLSSFLPATKQFIYNAVQKEPNITGKPIKHQFDKLVINPTRAVTSSFLSVLPRKKPMVIVIDALDECDDKESVLEFVQRLFELQKMHRLPFRVLVASRVEGHIQNIDSSAAHVIALQDFNAHADIQAFFRQSFATLYQENHLVLRSQPFPSNDDFDALATKCGGLFIFAVTLMRFIKNSEGRPLHRLKAALAVQTGLDPLYKQIVSAVPQNDCFKQVLGTIILLRHPIPITSVAVLIQLEPADIVESLLGLQSVLIIPGRDDLSVRLFHASLRDFFVDKDRSGALYIDPLRGHFYITINCLTVMSMGPRDGIFYSQEQQYASQNWLYHCLRIVTLAGGDGLSHPLFSSSFMDCLINFSSYHLDHWINTLVLDKQWETMLEMLQSMLSELQVSPVMVIILQKYAELSSRNHQITSRIWYRFYRRLYKGLRWVFNAC